MKNTDLINHEELWKSQAESLFKELKDSESNSIRQMVLNQYYLSALFQLKLINEYKQAIEYMPWTFYQLRTTHIYNLFKK
jgi:hypothetical protein